MRLSSCRKELIRWSKHEFANGYILIEQLKSRLAACNQKLRSHESIQFIAELTEAIDHALEHEELYLRKRARIDWLNAGDGNSKFFHLSTIKPRDFNSITGLSADDRKWLMENSEVSILEYLFFLCFQSLFIPSGSRSLDEALQNVEPRVTSQMN